MVQNRAGGPRNEVIPTPQSRLSEQVHPMRLGLDAYSLRWQGWDASRLIAFAGEMRIAVLQLLAWRHLPLDDESELRALELLARDHGARIEISAGCVDRFSSAYDPRRGSAEDWLPRAFRAARIFRSPSIHVTLGGIAERSGSVPLDEHIAECVRVARAVAPLARDLGVRLAFENYDDLLAPELRTLVERAGPDVAAVCLDTGNPVLAAEHPVGAAEILAPYFVTSHIRDTRVWSTPQGAMAQSVPMGQGSVDWRAILAILHDHAPDATFGLEVITGRAPRALDYLRGDSGFWGPYPARRTADLAQFIAWADRGDPVPFPQVTGDGVAGYALPTGPDASALIEQQARHCRESIRYCQETLALT